MTSYLYPPLCGCAPPADAPPGTVVQPTGPQPTPVQQFRLQKIGELETFLRSEVDGRSKLHKTYRRGVNISDGVCAVLDVVSDVTGAVGAGLLASGVGFLAGMVLEGITGAAGLANIGGVTTSRWFSRKAAKHNDIYTSPQPN
jgi:hypothetical protein